MRGISKASGAWSRNVAIAVAAGLGLAGLFLAPSASAGLSCRYVAAGPDGPRGNRLEIKATRFEEVVALLPGKGSNIEVTDDQRMKPLACKGGKPTMVNIDRVNFTADRRATGSSMYIAEAPEFGPGATPAEAGGKGITFIAKGPSLSFGIGGTDGPDLIQMGMEGKAAALDFFPDLYPDSESGDNIDAKIYAKFVNLLVRGGQGADAIAGSQIDYSSTWFSGPLRVPTSIYGEVGPDALTGGKSMDYLDGGPGGDFMLGAQGADQLLGGGGIDTFIAGPGRDEIDALDGIGGEDLRCGRGRDLARMDLKDQDRDCESFRFP